MRRAYGNRPTYLTARRDGRVAGVLGLVRQKSLLFGRHACSLPYFDASGILADDAAASAALVAAARERIAAERVRWVELRQIEPLDASLPTRTDKVTLWLELAGDAEATWDSLKTKVRNQVRKTAQKRFRTDGEAQAIL